MAVKFNDWRAQNVARRFPFTDAATLTGGGLKISDALFIDGHLYPIGGNSGLYLTQVTRATSRVTFTVGTEAATRLATASYTSDAVPESGVIAFTDPRGRPAGMLLSSPGELHTFSNIPEGTYTFTPAATRFAPTVITPQPDPGIRGVIVGDDADAETLTGDVWLVGVDGVVLREEDGAIRVDIVGDPFAERKRCADAVKGAEAQLLEPYNPIKTINGVAPNIRGNIDLRPGGRLSATNILRVVAAGTLAGAVQSHLRADNRYRTAVLRILTLGERRMRGASGGN